MLLAFKIKLTLACIVGLAGPTAMAPIIAGLQSPAIDIEGPEKCPAVEDDPVMLGQIARMNAALVGPRSALVAG